MVNDVLDKGNAMNVESKRAFKRVSLEVEVDLHSKTNFYTGFSQNISQGGMFIETHQPEELGSAINISFKLPNYALQIEVLGIVRWVREYNDVYSETPPGMGVEFAGLNPEVEKVLNEYISEFRDSYFHPEDDDDE